MPSASPVSLRTRLKKLRVMSAAELTHRLRYRWTLGHERRQHRAGRLAASDRLAAALRPELRGEGWTARLLEARRTSRVRFYALGQGAGATRSWLRERFADEHVSTSRAADQARRHEFPFFGQVFSYAAAIDWQADPVTGKRWPAAFHADVPVHAGDTGCGDVKHVWEINRHQFLIDLGKRFFLQREDGDRQEIAQVVRSWRAGNPYATGVNWSCALEPAFRAWSWLWAYHLCADDLDAAFHVEWLEGFYDHGRFLARHLERYSSPYNHLIGEAAALFALGICFPEFAESDGWRAQARDVLEGRLAEQFYSDGGSVEQSTFYHHATLGFYLLAWILAADNGHPLSASIRGAIERALEFSATLVQPDGFTPRIGGADDGKPIRLEQLPLWDFRPYQAIGAVLFGRGDFKWVAGRFYEDAAWLLGPGGASAFDALPSTPPAATAAILPASGYAVFRSDWSADADYVCMDIGEQAAGMRADGIPNSMHGHADCLSVVVCLTGRPVLVDSGLFAYNCGGPWEDHFRETAAHNTARVDGRDQALHIRKMAWSHSYRARIDAASPLAQHGWVLGSHDGYARQPDGVVHRRGVWLRDGGYVIVYDEFINRGEHAFDVNFQFAPGTLRLEAANHARFGDAAEMMWISDAAWEAEVRCGGPSPEDGWVCPSLGVREPAPRLQLKTHAGEGRLSLLTIVASTATGSSRLMATPAGECPALRVAGPEWTDLITSAHVRGGRPPATAARVDVARVVDGRTADRWLLPDGEAPHTSTAWSHQGGRPLG